jgi:hypothetical protein
MKLRILPFLFLLAFAPCAHAVTESGSNIIITSITATDEPSSFLVTGFSDAGGHFSFSSKDSWVGILRIPGLYAPPGRMLIPDGAYTLAQVLEDIAADEGGFGGSNGGGGDTGNTNVGGDGGTPDFSLSFDDALGFVVDVNQDTDSGGSGGDGGSGGTGPNGGGSTTTVPEPSTWALLLGSLAALVYYRRFRLARQIARRQ